MGVLNLKYAQTRSWMFSSFLYLKNISSEIVPSNDSPGTSFAKMDTATSTTSLKFRPGYYEEAALNYPFEHYFILHVFRFDGLLTETLVKIVCLFKSSLNKE